MREVVVLRWGLVLLERSGVRLKAFRDFVGVSIYVASRQCGMRCRPQEKWLSPALVGGLAVEAPLEACEHARGWVLNVSEVEDLRRNKGECTRGQHAVILEHVKEVWEKRGRWCNERCRTPRCCCHRVESAADRFCFGRVCVRRSPECRPLRTSRDLSRRGTRLRHYDQILHDEHQNRAMELSAYASRQVCLAEVHFSCADVIVEEASSGRW